MATQAPGLSACGICRRTLLVGEPVSLWTVPASRRLVKVCPLCRTKAERRGYHAADREPDDQPHGLDVIGAERNTATAPRLRGAAGRLDLLRTHRLDPVRDRQDAFALLGRRFEAEADRAADLEAERDELGRSLAEMAERLGHLGQELEAARRSSRAVVDDLGRERREREAERRDSSRDLGRLTHELADERKTAGALRSELAAGARRVADLEGSLAAERDRAGAAETEIARLVAELDEVGERLANLAEVRRREHDPTELRRVAAAAFNASLHADRMCAIARTLGRADAHIAVEREGIPRRISIVVAWELSWYEFRVHADLLHNSARIDEIRSGDLVSQIPGERRAWNGALTAESGVMTR